MASPKIEPSEATLRANAAYPSWLARAEVEAINGRRNAAAAPELSSSTPTVGLALSGGGIRSATFSLGLVQAMARADVLRRVDLLSTVSGGGYVGSFLGGLYSRVKPSTSSTKGGGASPAQSTQALATANAEAAAAPGVVDLVREQLLGDPESFAVGWLRENGRYLTPSGGGSSWLAGATLLRNWATLLLLVAVPALLLATAGELLHRAMYWLGERSSVDGSFWEDSVEWGGIWWSPLLGLPVLCFVLWVLPMGAAFWLVPTGHSQARRSGRKGTSAFAMRVLAGTLFVAAVAACWCWATHFVGDRRVVQAFAMAAGWAFGLITVAAWLVAGGLRYDVDGGTRHKLTACLGWGLVALALSSFIAVADSFGQTLYLRAVTGKLGLLVHSLVALTGTCVTIALSAHRLLAELGAPSKQRPRISLQAVALVAALLLFIVGAALLSSVSHAVLWWGKCPATVVADLKPCFGCLAAATCQRVPDWGPIGIWCLVNLLVLMALGRVSSLVNATSLSSFYASRLTRAYLGASNPVREAAEAKGEEGAALSVTEPIESDEFPVQSYRPHERGGPLHIINITLNETVDAVAQIRQPDRHGLAFALGPFSLSVGVRHHAQRVLTATTGKGAPMLLKSSKQDNVSAGSFQVFPGSETEIKAEDLGLGEWISISGAAVAPGMGSRTSLGTSLLTTMFNLRLGVWWDSGIEPSEREKSAKPRGVVRKVGRRLTRSFPVYGLLFDELLAHFHGTARRSWYLSDGGHYENTGCYELVRRRVPMIVCCDNGGDPDYAASDLANLVRLVRVDFHAEIEFLDNEMLQAVLAPAVRPYFGTLEDLRSTGWRDSPSDGRARAHAAIARIHYVDNDHPEREEHGILLVIKPTLCGEEPLDVRYYKQAHDTFPQESTADQFFDDAQWEAYRRLGEHIGDCLFYDESVEGEPEPRSLAATQDEQLEPWDPRSLDSTSLLALIRKVERKSRKSAIVRRSRG